MSSIHKIPGRCNKPVNVATAGKNISYCDRPLVDGETVCRYHQGVALRARMRYDKNTAIMEENMAKREAEESRRDTLVSLCANRSDADIKAAFALLDNREKVVEKLEGATGAINIAAQISAPMSELSGEHLADAVGRITAALALLQAEKEGKV